MDRTSWRNLILADQSPVAAEWDRMFAKPYSPDICYPAPYSATPDSDCCCCCENLSGNIFDIGNPAVTLPPWDQEDYDHGARAE